MTSGDSTQLQPGDANSTVSETASDLTVQRAGTIQVAQVWNVGDVILDQYEITGVLGEGGMGRVYKAHHRGWNTDLAVKSPKPEILTQAGGVENFIRECETWVNLGLHPHIVSCYYVRTLGGSPRVFAEYVNGGSLKDWIEKRTLYKGKEKALERMLDLAIQFAWGLHYAHEAGLVHQDVKPANLMVTKEGIAKVTDFGLAKARSISPGVTAPSGQSIMVSAGGMTPAYCSPEQAQHKPLTRKTDIWSWGVSILEMFVGEVTWLAGQAAAEALAGYLENGPEYKAIPRMPADLAVLLKRCFAQKPDERPQTMAEIAEALLQIYADQVQKPYSRVVPKASELQADGLNNKALSLHDLGRIDEAIASWQAGLKAAPGHLETTYNLGLVQWRTGQIDDTQLLRELHAATASSDQWQHDWLLIQVYIERGDLEQAKKLLKGLPKKVASRPEVVALLDKIKGMKDSVQLHRDFKGDTHGISALSLSQDDHYAVSGGWVHSIQVWNVATGKCIQTLDGHTDAVSSVFLSENGKYILSGSDDKTLKFWELQTGKCAWTFEGHQHFVTCVCLTPDGHYALSGSVDNTLKLWDFSTGRCARTFDGHSSSVTCLSLSEDGKYAVSGSLDATLKLWDIATGACLRTFTGHEITVDAVSLSMDGRLALSGGYDKTVKLWDVNTGKCLRTMQGHIGSVNCVCLSRDGRLALSGSEDNTLKLWDVATGRCLQTVEGHENSVLALCLSRDGRLALSASDDGALKLWDVNVGDRCPASFAVSHFVASEAAITVDQLLQDAQNARQRGDRIAEVSILRAARSVQGYEHNARIIEAWSSLYRTLKRSSFRTSWLARTFKGHEDGVNSVCLSSDGYYALSGSDDCSIKLWEVATGKTINKFSGGLGPSNSVCFSVDGCYVLAGGSDPNPKMWEVSTGNRIQWFSGHTRDVYSVCLTEDGKYALSGSADKTVKYWDVKTGKCLRTFTGHARLVYSVCFSRDGRFALSGSQDKTVKLWEVGTGKCLKTFDGHQGSVHSVCISSDGRYVLSGSDDRTVKCWDAAGGACIGTFEGHTQSVNSVCFSPDGQFVLSAAGKFETLDISSGAKDNSIKLWDFATRQCLRTIPAHTACVTSLSLSKDGHYILSGSRDNTLKLWELDWELESHEPADYDDGADPYLQNFLALHRTKNWLGQWNKPAWAEADFEQLMFTLGCAGYGWLRPEGVHQALKRMAKK